MQAIALQWFNPRVDGVDQKGGNDSKHKYDRQRRHDLDVGRTWRPCFPGALEVVRVHQELCPLRGLFDRNTHLSTLH